jgi:two-component system, LytTR family, response regulator
MESRMSDKIKCIAIDDEPLALEVIKNHVAKLEELELVETFYNPIKAFNYIKENEIDLIFLDIQMPELSGLDLLKLIPRNAHVVLTTAYVEYAFESYQLDVTDYLLKPILFDRFFKSVNKVQKYIELEQKSKSSPKTDSVVEIEDDFIFVNTEYKIVKIDLNDILYVEAWRDYVKIITKEDTILSLLGISLLEQQLPKTKFLRVHRSFIIAPSNIESIERNRIYINGNWIPIGGSYKEVFQAWLEKHKIG